MRAISGRYNSGDKDFTVYSNMFEGQNFRGFRAFSFNRKCFPTNYGFVDRQCKSTSMLLQKFSSEWKFCTLTVKVFPLESFAVYSKIWQHTAPLWHFPVHRKHGQCTYVEQYFAANKIEDADQQRAILLSVCGPATYRLIQNLVPPKKPTKLNADLIDIRSATTL